MPINTVDAGQGLAWFTEGWKLFVKSPGMWIVSTIVFFAIAVVLSLIPLLGQLILGLIVVALIAGFLNGAKTVDEGGEMTVGALFSGLSDSTKRGRLLILGVLLLVAEIIFAVVVGASMMSGPMSAGMGGAMGGEMPAIQFGMGMFVGLLLGLVLLAVLLMAFMYATPLVMFTDVDPIAAIKSSFDASLKNFLPLLIFGIIYVILAVVAAIPFGLGFLVLFPVTACAWYCSYKTIFQ
ncbi:MAG: BPSS1780 family membrane protein [Gammaproteobacteria bacterium]|nr:BPSS1780 family membrane protein [Gammaproteobacteria bacterium]MDH3464880.1 BPSS1780 family membrane protein [Gammaproteobacteria bacterium]